MAHERLEAGARHLSLRQILHSFQRPLAATDHAHADNSEHGLSSSFFRLFLVLLRIVRAQRYLGQLLQRWSDNRAEHLLRNGDIPVGIDLL